jgi:hypothetical protein
MKKILSGLCASTLALTFGLVTIAPVAAAPIFVPKANEVSANIQNVQFDPDWRRHGRRAENRMERRQDRFERRSNRAYYNGHRGYNERRRGYRQHNGVWFPAAAFIAGAIMGGVIDNPPRRLSRANGNAHIEWCYDRYRSYRASDNTFQPYNGPRQQCISS